MLVCTLPLRHPARPSPEPHHMFEPSTLLFNDRLRVVSDDGQRIRLERVATGKPVTVTYKMIETTRERLRSGQAIPKREISYTSAIEAVVLAALDGEWIERDGCYEAVR